MNGSSFSSLAEPLPVATTRRIVVCVGIALFGIFAFIGLHFAPTPPDPQSLSYIAPRVPEAKLRFAWLDARDARIADTSLIAKLQKLAPDYLLAENMDAVDLMPLARALNMEQSLAGQLFQPTHSPAGSHGNVGVCILSKYPLLDAEPLTQAGKAYGVSAFSVVQSRKFMLACVCINDGGNPDAAAEELIAYWQKNQRPPFVGAGIFNWAMQAGALVQPTTGWFDGLTPFEQIAPPQQGATAPPLARIMFTEGWSCLAGGFDSTPGGQNIAWADAISAHVVATSTTAPSDLDD